MTRLHGSFSYRAPATIETRRGGNFPLGAARQFLAKAKIAAAQGPPLRSSASRRLRRFGSIASYGAHNGKPSQTGHRPHDGAHKMKNFAEFQILGRVGKIKQFDGKVNVTVCANYPTKKDSETRENPHWNEVSIFSEAVRDYADEIRQGRRPGSGPGTHEAEQFRAQRREGLHGRSYRGGLLNSRVEKPEGD